MCVLCLFRCAYDDDQVVQSSSLGKPIDEFCIRPLFPYALLSLVEGTSISFDTPFFNMQCLCLWRSSVTR